MGVRGMKLKQGDEVVDMVVADEALTLLTVTENGYGKRTKISDYSVIRRGGQGVINIQCNERNGSVVAVKAVADKDDLMIISKNGIIIRTLAGDISVIGRNTQGVRLMRLETDDIVMSAARIINEESDEELEHAIEENPEVAAKGFVSSDSSGIRLKEEPEDDIEENPEETNSEENKEEGEE